MFDVVGTLDSWKKGDPPRNQEVNVIVNSYSKIQDGYIAITPRLSSDSEVDFEIDKIINELEKIRKKAKKHIHKTNENIKESLKDHDS